MSDANSYLVITGGGVDDVRIVKKSWIFWWQKVCFAAGAAIEDLHRLSAYQKHDCRRLFLFLFFYVFSYLFPLVSPHTPVH